MKSISFISFSFFLILLSSCSGISKKDCQKNMYELGMEHGKNGSQVMHTEEIQKVCEKIDIRPDLHSYQQGFYKGWEEYCLPNRAYLMGQKGERYFSFCPKEREHMFREKYLLGKQYNELKDLEEELEEKIKELKKEIGENPSKFQELQKHEKFLIKIQQDLRNTEVEAQKNNFYFTNPI